MKQYVSLCAVILVVDDTKSTEKDVCMYSVVAHITEPDSSGHITH